MTVVEIESLRRDFGEVRAVDGISLSIERGEVLGLLGHNGAGKTTVVRLIAGLLAPTSGRVRVDGLDPMTDGPEVRRRLGVLPTGPFLDLRLTARHNLLLAADLFGLSRKGLDRRIEAALADFELTGRADDRVDGFSAGMRQRVALARVLLPGPEILLLDEPSAQLDPLAVRMVRDLIARLARDAGRTVVLCTHDLNEAQLLCDRVVVLDHGRIATGGRPADLGASLAAGAVDLEVAAEDVPLVRTLLSGDLAERPGKGGSVILRTRQADREDLPELVRKLALSGVRVYRLQPYEPSLEDVYLALYDEERSG